MDSDEDGDNDRVISLTHLLFGNIDDDGQLENDFLDPESIRHLDQLRQLGIGTQLKEITDDVDSPDLDQKDCNELEECTVKSPSAIDYSDITELADETDEMDLDGASTPSESLKTKEEGENDVKRIEENHVDVKPSDSDLMPPPALPPPKDSIENLNDSNVSVGMFTNSEVNNKRELENININNTVLKAPRILETTEKKLDTPLAAMLPSKYKNMDVTKLFPEFRHGQVLRFSRLFGPGKPTSLPQIWRGVKKKKKKKTGEESTNAHKASKGLTLDIPSSPPRPDECESDDEMKLLKPEEKNRLGTKNESYKSNELSPGFAAWRYGPSQLWYDMLNVPESGEGFDYGFRLKEELYDSSAKTS